MATREQHETEGGFGTGLRGKLERRRDEEAAPPAEPESPPPAAVAAAAPAEPVELAPAAAVALPDFGELEALRADLAQALDREQDLRDELEELQEALTHGKVDSQTLSIRSEEIDGRAAKLAAAPGRARGARAARFTSAPRRPPPSSSGWRS